MRNWLKKGGGNVKFSIELTNPQAVQDFIYENPSLHSVYELTGTELRDAITFYIEQHMAREKFDPDAEFLFYIDHIGSNTIVAVKRGIRVIQQ
jgi:hypothetical protein